MGQGSEVVSQKPQRYKKEDKVQMLAAGAHPMSDY